MSYVPPQKEDSLNELFSRLVAFTKMKDNLLNADSEQTFLIWFDKLQKIDRRTLFIYIRQNITTWPIAWLRPVNDFFWQIGEPLVPYELIESDKEKLEWSDFESFEWFRNFRGLLKEEKEK